MVVNQCITSTVFAHYQYLSINRVLVLTSNADGGPTVDDYLTIDCQPSLSAAKFTRRPAKTGRRQRHPIGSRNIYVRPGPDLILTAFISGTAKHRLRPVHGQNAAYIRLSVCTWHQCRGHWIHSSVRTLRRTSGTLPGRTELTLY